MSDSEDIPLYLPDRFEPGTPNLPAFTAGRPLEYLEGITVEAVAAHDRALTARLLGGLREIPGVVLIGPDSVENRVGVFSLDFPGKDNAEIAARLEEGFGILTRCGLHCAPSAHRTLGTFPRGTVRLSPRLVQHGGRHRPALRAIKAVSAG